MRHRNADRTCMVTERACAAAGPQLRPSFLSPVSLPGDVCVHYANDAAPRRAARAISGIVCVMPGVNADEIRLRGIESQRTDERSRCCRPAPPPARRTLANHFMFCLQFESIMSPSGASEGGIKGFLSLKFPKWTDVHYVHVKPPLSMFKKFSKLASFVQLQFNSMNICLFSVKLPILVKVCPNVIEILIFNKWS